MPPADIHVDEAVVRTLLDGQCPDLADRALRHEADGFDKSIWRLGDDLAVRLPRRRSAVEFLENEITWLPRLAADLPLAIPVPVRVGAATADFPYPWMVTAWFKGALAAHSQLRSPDETAVRLGAFLRALHRDAPPDAPENPYRGVPLGERREAFESRAHALDGRVDVAGARRLFEAGSSAPHWRGARQWLHGDLHPFNLVVTSGELSAVVDFGDLCAGDPAVDLACGWMFLPLSSVEKMWHAYATSDEDLVVRALGWTVLFATIFLELGVDGRNDYPQVGARTIEVALAFDSSH